MLVLLSNSCNFKDQKKMTTKKPGQLIIFHAGSLSVPFHEIADSFNQEYPNINVKLEASGSVDAARKISDLGRKADIMASADYKIIDKLLIPKHAEWLIKFAANEMVIAYDKDSKYASKINKENWYEIILNEDVFYGRSDPNSDPCGYRSVLTSKLAEDYYGEKNLSNRILNKNKNFIRPKETDLLALLEVNALDYIFIYRSVAVQHDLDYIPLPDSINLSNPEYAEHYKKATVEISGTQPGETITLPGEPMIYGITIPKSSTNRENAETFLHFVLSVDKGLKILEKNGQPSLVPSPVQNYTQLPDGYKKYATDITR
jgi:molybdate/tungstate transport system substrate-binding protein